MLSRPARTSALALSLALALLAPVALPDAAIERALAEVSESRIMPVSEIQPGMRGYGLTVFRGTRPERFEVEVIGVLHQFRPDQDLILVRTEHPILTDAPTVGGMSGSPIFLNDRLIGAYAYGWPFGRHPVAGVTPIANMMQELRRSSRPTSFPGATPLTPMAAAPMAAAAPVARAGRVLPPGVEPYLGAEPRHALSALEGTRRAPLRAEDGTTLVPASTPLLVGGLDPSVLALWRPLLEPYGLDVLQAGGAGAAPSAEEARAGFVDGGAIAVTLARGDIANTAIGTVTLVDGQRLVAFGHPMLQAGEVGLPTATARIVHVLASVQRSFKIAEPIRPLGTLTQDRQAAIVVDTGLVPEMIPVRLRVTGVPTDQRTEWNFEVASHRSISPMVVGGAILSAVKSVAPDADFVTFEARSRVGIEGLAAPIELVDRGFSAAGVAQETALRQLRVFDAMELAYANPFRETRVRSIEIELDLRFARETAEIVDASIQASEVNPGEDVEVRVVLRRFSGDEEVRRLSMRVPASAAGRSVQILVQPGNAVTIERPEPRSLDDVVDAVRRRYSSSELVLSARLPSRGVLTPSHVARAVPTSVLDAMQSTTDSDRTRVVQTYARRAFSTDLVLTGSARVELNVRAIAR